VNLQPQLAGLDRNGLVSATKLVLALGVTQPDVASCIAQLALQQQVEVNRDEKDQSSKMICLTAAGKALVQKGKKSCGPMWSRPCGEFAADCRALCLCSWSNYLACQAWLANFCLVSLVLALRRTRS
jgi:DNA-binding MarR family transcriptional regulator